MPGLQGEGVVAAQGSPSKKSRLSLKFFQKKETKRALDFSEPQAEEASAEEPEPEETTRCVTFSRTQSNVTAMASLYECDVLSFKVVTRLFQDLVPHLFPLGNRRALSLLWALTIWEILAT